MSARIGRVQVRGLVLDAVCVVAFVGIGRASHGEGESPVAFLGTLWPFGVGLLAGWWALTRRPGSSPEPTHWSAGLVAGGYAAVVGLALRGLAGQGVALSFAVVAVVVLCTFMVGWRAVLGRRLRASASTAEDSAPTS